MINKMKFSAFTFATAQALTLTQMSTYGQKWVDEWWGTHSDLEKLTKD